MNRKITLDLLILISSLTGLILSYLYQEDGVKRDSSLLLLGLVFLGSLGLVALDRRKWAGAQERKGEKGITQLLLLGEEGNVTDTWDIYGKTSIVFGRDEGDFQVDINLKFTDYGSTVDGEHAVMNYCNGCWYIEDLDSENGTRIQPMGEEQKYRVSSKEPCRVERGDIIYIGLAPVKLR